MTAASLLDMPTFQDEMTRAVAAIPSSRRSPMLHEIWLRACALSLACDARFEIVSAMSNSQPIAAAVFSRAGKIAPRLHLLGAEELLYPTDVLYKDQSSAVALAEAVVNRKLPARFGHFDAGSAFLEALTDASRSAAFMLTTEIHGAPYIRFDDTWRDPETKLKARRRSDLRRRLKKAEVLGAVTFDVLSPKPHEVDTLIEEAIAVEANSWKGRSRTALAYDQTQQAFFRHYARLASEAGILRLAFMRIDGKAVAMQIAALCDNAFWGFKSGYDEAYREFSPGMILFREVVRYAANSGVATHEFLGKPAPWTQEWTTDQRPLVRLRYYPFNPAGAAALIPDAIIAVTERAKSWFIARFSRQ